MSEEIMLAGADLAELARLNSDLRELREIGAQKDRALAAAHAKIAMVESQLGTAQAEITRLEEAMRDAARMFTIKGARKVIAQALDDPALDVSPHKR